nr:ATP synthase F0 subunit 8 [Conlopa bredoni]WRK21430.1 ATP synthase F0 subunit 8 [Conlopa bredoni]
MPQMSPIWWMVLMLMFNMTMMTSMIKLYFNTQAKLKLKKNINFKKMNWW